MAKRLTRKLTDVAVEVEQTLKTHFNVTQEQLDSWYNKAHASPFTFPKSNMVSVDDLYIDYEVQRDVIHDHIKNIMKNWDPRICSPGSACTILNGDNKIYLYDAQHRTIAAVLLGFKEVPCAIVETNDIQFPSLAFEMLNDTGVRKLNPGDLHRNALVRYKNGSRDIKNVRARTMQDQFDTLGIDLEDKNTRKSPTLRGNNDYFFSHFKYAQKGIELDEKGAVLEEILDSIKSTFQMQEEIDQGVYIGLFEIFRLSNTNIKDRLPAGWMKEVLVSCKQTFKSSHLLHSKAKVQWEYSHPGAGWNAPLAMSNFLRELYIRNGGTINLPFHGDGSKIGIEAGNIAPGLFPEEAA
jgi:hypothetical protein